MALRHPNGKRLSGHAQRKHAAAPLPSLTRAARAAFAEIGAPPADADELLTWGRRLLSAIAWLLATGELDAQRPRAMKDVVAAIGLTHNRGVLEATVKRLEIALRDRTQQGAVEMVPFDAVKKSPNARGMRRGPRRIPPDAVDDTPPPRTDDDPDQERPET